MKPKTYWQKRSQQIGARQFKKADEYERVMLREYQKAQKNIQRDIESFYGRYADNNQVIMEDARKLLTQGEMKEYKMTLEEFTKKAQDNADGRWTKELNNAYYKTRVSRFEALQTQINLQVEMISASKQAGVGKVLGDAYEDTYYRTLHEIQTGTGMGSSFARIDKEGMDKVLGSKLDGRNWSDRIWDDRTKLKQELHTKLSQSMIRGDSVERMSRDLAERMGVSYNRARTLVQTETAFFVDQATMESYKESGVVERYENLATLDESTCPICGGMDGKVFPLGQMDVGVNYPPFHARCRCTTIPYFYDEVEVGQRAARNQDGEVYYVSSEMDYEKWKNEYVDSPETEENGTIQSDFTKVVTDMPEANTEYTTVIKERYQSGSEQAKSAIDKYISTNPVGDGKYKGGAHYSPGSKKVNMNFEDDLNNPQGDGMIYYHEVGHAVDHLAGGRLSGSEVRFVSHMDVGDVKAGDFKKAILSDVRPYIINYADQNGLSIPEAMAAVGNQFKGDNKHLYSGVSDIFGGATGNKAMGAYGHATDYWDKLPNALELEAFAHMFEASFDKNGQRKELMERFLPNAFAVFKRILEAI